MNLPIYLDYMATTPIDPRVAAEMQPFLDDMNYCGNPSSDHAYGYLAKKAVQKAAHQVARLIQAEPESILWTSGATESINMAIKGVANVYQRKGRHIITTAIEHKAVLHACESLKKDDFEITVLSPDRHGIIEPGQVAEAIRADTLLVSINHVNNEIGVIQDIATIGDITRSKGVLLHVDAAQSPGKTWIDVKTMNVDLLSLSSHKVYGPKGMGALYIRQAPKLRLEPLLHGGGQQSGLRSGTIPAFLIAGMGKACEIAQEDYEADQVHLRELREMLLNALMQFPEVVIHGDLEKRVKNNINFSVQHINGDALLVALRELALSTTSACNTASMQSSHVLNAIGVPDVLAENAIRLSFGRLTTKAEMELACQAIEREIRKLLNVSPEGAACATAK